MEKESFVDVERGEGSCSDKLPTYQEACRLPIHGSVNDSSSFSFALSSADLSDLQPIDEASVSIREVNLPGHGRGDVMRSLGNCSSILRDCSNNPRCQISCLLGTFVGCLVLLMYSIERSIDG